MLDIAYIRSEGFRRYFANTSWLVAEKVVRIGVAFFVGIRVARRTPQLCHQSRCPVFCRGLTGHG